MSSVERGPQGFKDHFSGHAGDYAHYRPRYPRGLFDWLASVAPGTGLAWDVACGSGQATVALAARFEQVAGSDASREQVREAAAHPRADYLVARAEAAGLRSGIADLVTVAQGAHWFDMEAFAREAARVARDGGVIALWCYALAAVTPAVDAAVRWFYDDLLGPFWPPERRLIEERYRTLHFPFREIRAPDFDMIESWSLDRFLGYLGTWSAYRRYIQEGDDPLPALRDRLGPAWGPGEREVRWPLHLRVGIAGR